MSKQPSPRSDALRAMREANYEKAQQAMKVEAAPKPKKPKRKPKA